MPEQDTNNGYVSSNTQTDVLSYTPLSYASTVYLHSKWNTERKAITAGDLITWQTLLGRVLMRRTLTHSQKANGYLQQPSLELTNTFSFHFPWYGCSIPSRSLYVRNKHRLIENVNTTGQPTVTQESFQLFKCLQMFVKFGLHQDGAGGIQNTALLALGKITHAET